MDLVVDGVTCTFIGLSTNTISIIRYTSRPREHTVHFEELSCSSGRRSLADLYQIFIRPN